MAEEEKDPLGLLGGSKKKEVPVEDPEEKDPLGILKKKGSSAASPNGGQTGAVPASSGFGMLSSANELLRPAPKMGFDVINNVPYPVTAVQAYVEKKNTGFTPVTFTDQKAPAPIRSFHIDDTRPGARKLTQKEQISSDINLRSSNIRQGEELRLPSEEEFRAATAPIDPKVLSDQLTVANENLGAAKLADFVAAQPVENAGDLADGIRENNRNWNSLPVAEREKRRNEMKEAATVAATASIDADEKRRDEVMEKLRNIKATRYDSFDGTIREKMAAQAALEDEIKVLNTRISYNKLRPDNLAINIFENDDDVIADLKGPAAEFLSRFQELDPEAYKMMANSLYSGDITEEQKRELIKGALGVQSEEIQQGIDFMKKSGKTGAVRNYMGKVAAYDSLVKKRDLITSGINGAPTNEQTAQLAIVNGEATLLKKQIDEMEEKGVKEDMSSLQSINSQITRQQQAVAASSLKYDLLHDENKQKEIDRFVEENPVIGRIWNAAKKVAGLPGQILKTGAEIGEMIGYKGSALVGHETDTGAFNKLSGRKSVTGMLDAIIPDQAQLRVIKGDGSVDMANVMNGTVNTLVDMTALLAGGEGIGTAVKGLGMGVKSSSAFGLMMSSYAQTRPEYFKHAIEAGISPDDANTFADASAIVTSALEMVSPNRALFGPEATSQFTKEFAKYYSEKGWQYAMKRGISRIYKEVLPENAQEISQLLGDKAIEFATNKIYNRPVFDASISSSELKETVLMTTLATGILTGIRNPSVNAREKSSYLVNAARNFEEFQSTLNELNLKPSDKDAVYRKVAQYASAINSIPASVPLELQDHIAPLVVAKQQLDAQAKNPEIDEVFRNAAREKSKVIEKVIADVADGKSQPSEIIVSDNPLVASTENTAEAITSRREAIAEAQTTAEQAAPAPQTEEQPGNVMYVPTIGENGRIESVSPQYTEGASQTVLRQVGENDYELNVGETDVSQALMKQFHELRVDPIFDSENAFSPEQPIIQIEPARYRKSENGYELVQKGKIRYGAASENKVADIAKEENAPAPEAAETVAQAAAPGNPVGHFALLDNVRDWKSSADPFTVTDNGEVELDPRANERAYMTRDTGLSLLYNQRNDPASVEEQKEITVLKKPKVKIVDGNIVVQSKGEIIFGKNTGQQLDTSSATNGQSSPGIGSIINFSEDNGDQVQGSIVEVLGNGEYRVERPDGTDVTISLPSEMASMDAENLGRPEKNAENDRKHYEEAQRTAKPAGDFQQYIDENYDRFSDVEKELADRIKSVIDPKQIKLQRYSIPNYWIGGFYSPLTDGIYINMESASQPLFENNHAVLHEVLHKMTVFPLYRHEQGKSINEHEKELVDEIQRIYDDFLKIPGAQDYYGMKNIMEFVAEAYTSRRFSEFLGAQNVDMRLAQADPGYWGEFEDDSYSLWERIVNAVSRFITGSNLISKRTATEKYIHDLIYDLMIFNEGNGQKLYGGPLPSQSQTGPPARIAGESVTAYAIRVAQWQLQNMPNLNPQTGNINGNANTATAPVFGNNFTLPKETLRERLVRKNADFLNRLATAIKAIEGNGAVVPSDQNPHIEYQLLGSRTANKVDRLMEDIVDGNVRNKKPLFKRVKEAGLTVQELGLFMYAQFAPERNQYVADLRQTAYDAELGRLQNLQARNAAAGKSNTSVDAKIADLQSGRNAKFQLLADGGSGMTNDQSALFLSEFDRDGKTAELEMFAEEYREKVTRPDLQMQFDSGMISQAEYDAMKKFANYIPLQVESKIEKSFTSSVKNLMRNRKTANRTIGSAIQTYDKRVNPAIYGLIQYEKSAVSSAKNDWGTTLRNLVVNNPNPDVWEIKKPRYVPEYDQEGKLVKMQEVTPKEVIDQSLKAFENGRPYYIQIHDETLRRAIRQEGVTKGIGFLNTLNTWYRGVYTTYNPNFVLENFIRDPQEAAFMLSGEAKGIKRKFFSNIPGALKGVIQHKRGNRTSEWAKTFDEYLESGSEISFAKYDTDLKKLDNVAKKLEKYSGKTISPLRALQVIGDGMKAASSVLELTTRVAAFKAAKDSGFDTNKAALMSRNVTVDFNKKGEWTPLLNSAYLFMNAGTQGGFNMLRKVLTSSSGRKVMASYVAAGFFMGMVNSLMGGDEDDEDNFYKQPEYMRSSSFMFKNPAGKGFFKIPIGRALASPFYFGSELYGVISGQVKPWDATKSVALSTINSHNPLGSSQDGLQLISPTITDPYVQMKENKNNFGNPLYKEQKFGAKKPESQVYFKSANELSVSFADLLNNLTGGSPVESGALDISPDKIDWVVQQAAGGTGKFVKDNIIGFGMDLTEGDKEGIVKNAPVMSRFYTTGKPISNASEVFRVLEQSGNKKLSADDFKGFAANVKKAIKDKEIEPKDAKKYLTEFQKNQARIEISRKHPDWDDEKLDLFFKRQND